MKAVNNSNKEFMIFPEFLVSLLGDAMGLKNLPASFPDLFL